MRRQHWVTWLIAACMCLMTAHLASAQSGTATLQGKVIDAQKMALPGANVTLANPATGFSRTTQSDASGAFAFPGVPPGTYALTVEMQGFKTSVVEKVALQVDSTSELSIDLQIGSLSESVQVVADAPVINTTDASIGNVIGGNTDPQPAARGPQRRRAALACSRASPTCPRPTPARRWIRATAR